MNGNRDGSGWWKITDVRVIDPYRQQEWLGDVIVGQGHFQDGVATVGETERVEIVAGRGLWLVPRLLDMHVHFRAPGQEWKEDLASGAAAAAHGGFSAVVTMPNTDPVVDSPSLVSWQIAESRRIGLVDVLPAGAVTKTSQGHELAELWKMEQAGAVAFSDDGRPVADGGLMRSALSYSATLSRPIVQHAEDLTLSGQGVMHEGAVSGRLGLAGVPGAAEAVVAWRDVQLAALTGGRLHIAHVSTPGALEAIQWAKAHDLSVTAEVTPHHLFFTDERVAELAFSPATKVNPPLRPESYRQALLQAMKSGLIDVIASDHAPHHADEKDLPYNHAPFGISGLETAVAAVITVGLGELAMSPLALFERMTAAPHRILGLAYRGLTPGEWADFALIDPDARWTVDPGTWYSQGKHTPWRGMELRGQVVAAMHRGRWTVREGEVLPCAAH